MNNELTDTQVNNIMQKAKLVNIGEFTQEDWDIIRNTSRVGRLMVVNSIEEATGVSTHNDALIMLEHTMGYDEFGDPLPDPIKYRQCLQCSAEATIKIPATPEPLYACEPCAMEIC